MFLRLSYCLLHKKYYFCSDACPARAAETAVQVFPVFQGDA